MNDSYPLPNINKLFSCLDSKQGYHQIPLTIDSIALTAFVTPEGLYEHIMSCRWA